MQKTISAVPSRMWILSLVKVKLHGICPCQAFVQGGLFLDFISTSEISPLSLRIRQSQKYGIFQYQILLRNEKVAQRLGDRLTLFQTQHPTRNHLVQILCCIATISITSAGDVEGCYGLDTVPENICIASAVLASIFAINTISSLFPCGLLPFLSKSSLYLLKDRNSKAL